MGLNLGQDWEFQPDAPNNRLYAEYGPSGSQFSFDESGDLILDSGSLDLSGGSLTDSSQDYVDLTGDGNDLRLATGQSIEDGSGIERVEIGGNNTNIRPSDGDPVIVAADSNTDIRAYSDKRVQISDEQGGFTGLEYNTSASAPGTLELTNANLNANGNDITNGGDVNADQVTTPRLITRQEAISNEPEQNVEFTGLNPDESTLYRLYLRFDAIASGNGSLRMTVNNYTDTDYQTVRSDGTSVQDPQGWQLYTTSTVNAHAGAELSLFRGGAGRPLVTGPVAAGQFERIDNTLTSGGVQVNEWPITSIEFNSSQSGDSNFNFSQATLARYDY